MKHFLILILLSLSSVVAFAQQSQLKRGSTLINGNVNLTYGDNLGQLQQFGNIPPTSLNFKMLRSNVMLNAGYFVADNFAVGAGIGGGIHREYPTDNMLSEVSIYSYGGRVFARHYIQLSKNFAFFSEIYTYYGFEDGKRTRDDQGQEQLLNEIKGNTLNVGINAGLALFASKYLSIDFNVGVFNYFTSQRTDESFTAQGETNLITKVENSRANMQLSLSNLNFNIGVSLFL